MPGDSFVDLECADDIVLFGEEADKMHSLLTTISNNASIFSVEIRGAATILDVSFSAKSLSGEEDTWSQCVNELLVELRQCRRRADNLVNRIIRTEKQRCVLETFADSLSRREDEILLGGNHHGHVALNNLPNHTGVADQVNNIPSQGATLSGGTTPANAQMAAMTAEHKCINDIINPYDPRNVETLHKFLEIYKDEAERFDTVLMDTTEELEQVRTRIETLEKEVRDIELKQDEHLARNTALALPILAFTSESDSPCSLMMLSM
ncbi:unnamed protein product [Schistosoma margrebowiei]|uniref:Uncharacterized protein n=1 Tax=Schistosoma margrebowiei TaxID=48269 RepID=A0A3P8H5Q9_9TREM|nr:unnamed protein product [Schistosoma margrebowiei]